MGGPQGPQKTGEEQVAELVKNIKARLSRQLNPKGLTFAQSESYTSLARLVGGDEARRVMNQVEQEVAETKADSGERQPTRPKSALFEKRKNE